MLPSLLAVEALDAGIDMVALTDHNSTRNIPAFAEACSIAGIVGVFGLEVTTIEGVHVLALFGDAQHAVEFGLYIESILPPYKNMSHIFGDQLIVDVGGEVQGEVEKSLYGAASLSIDDLVDQVLQEGGLVIPAHIDRQADSLLANLGFVPDLPYSAIEAIRIPCHADVHGKTVVQGSDAHCLEHVGRRRCFAELQSLDVAGLRHALQTGSISYLTPSF